MSENIHYIIYKIKNLSAYSEKSMKKTTSAIYASASLFAFAMAANGAQINTYDSPMIEGNQALIESQLGWVTPNMNMDPTKFSTGALNFTEIFGADFDPNLHDVKVITLSKDFGIRGQDLGVFNGVGTSDAMHLVRDGYSGYIGSESYITYDTGEGIGLAAYSAYLNKTYEIFGDSNTAFAWATQDVSTLFYEENDGRVELVNRDVKTLILGFEDSNGIWDWDYNDVIFAIQVVAKDQAGLSFDYKNQAPAGQPMPGVMASAVIALAAIGLWTKRRKPSRA